MQDFSIQGIKKQWEWQQSEYIVKLGMPGGPLEGQEHYFKKIGGFILPQQMGCKTETRRTRGLDKVNEFPYRWQVEDLLVDGLYKFTNTKTYDTIAIKCPYGVVGDNLFVQEKWMKRGESYIYFDSPDAALVTDNRFWQDPFSMTEEQSRIKLEITGIGVERLHDITEEGALREGVYPTGERGVISTHGEVADFYQVGEGKSNGTVILSHTSARNTYLYAFGYLHGEELVKKNPWVWVIQFTVKEFKQ